MKDLVVVVPDSNTEQTLYGLLERHKALQIRRIEYRILVHPERDPGVLQRGASLSPHVVDVFTGGDAEVFQRVVESFPKTPLGKPQKPKEAV
jgi:hypothetical protein